MKPKWKAALCRRCWNAKSVMEWYGAGAHKVLVEVECPECGAPRDDSCAAAHEAEVPCDRCFDEDGRHAER